jgi:hypothetical protein
MQKGPKVVINEEAIGTRKALITSVSDYYSTSNLQALDFCKNDGEEMYDLLKSLGYEILDSHKLVGQVKFDTMRDAIYDFFDNANTKAEDTLIFYFSGHGVPAPDGDMCLASSEINPDDPYRRGFSSYELTRLIQNSNSIRIVTILDCCYSGAAKISKGIEDAAAKIGTAAIEEKARRLQQPQGEGKCLLAASQAAQEAYGLKEQDHSIFTYYLLEGLRGNEKSVDVEGNVTPYSLGSYVYRTILNLPAKRRPKQKPITKVEASGDIILASYPNLVKSRDVSSAVTAPAPPSPSTPAESGTSPLLPSQAASSLPQSPTLPTKDTSSSSPSTKDEHYSQPTTIKEKKQQQPWTNPKILIPIIVAVAVIAAAAFFMMRPSPEINALPIVNAGADQTVNVGDSVTLDGSRSSDSDGNIVSYLWKQIAGPTIVLKNSNTVSPSFTAPDVTSDTKMTFDLTAKDDKGATSSKSDSVDVIVKAKAPPQPVVVNNPPKANDESIMTDMNKPVDIILTASDPEIKDNLTAVIVSKPLNGTLTEINQNTGVVKYTPNPGFTGVDSFTFKANDGKVDSNPGTVKITVNQQQQQPPSEPLNHAPVVNNQSVTTSMNKPVDITLTASDPEIKDNLTAAIVSKPLHGTLSDIEQNTGLITYTPNPGFTGTDEFTFKANDGKVRAC